MTVNELKELLNQIPEEKGNMEILVSSMKYYDNFPIRDAGIDDCYCHNKWLKKFFIAIE